jgi:hypothetical protein
MVKRIDHPDHVVEFSNERGCVMVMPFSRGVLLTAFCGHVDESLAHPVAQEVDLAIVRGRCTHLFFDSDGMTGYATELRTGLTDVVKRRAPKSVNVLVRSRIVAMGVSIANLALGGLVKSFSDDERFDDALAKVAGESARSARHRLRAIADRKATG